MTDRAPSCIINYVVSTTALHIAGWSSLAARRAHNPKVVGSNPTPATIWRHSSAGQSIRFIPEVSCVRITLPLPKIPVNARWLVFLYLSEKRKSKKKPGKFFEESENFFPASLHGSEIRKWTVQKSISVPVAARPSKRPAHFINQKRKAAF